MTLQGAGTVQAALALATALLVRSGSPTARLDAEVLLAHCLGWSRGRLYSESDRPLDRGVLDQFSGLVGRRADQEPVAYLVGRQEFYGRMFSVSPAVLIPRAETEIVVERALRWIRQHAIREPSILDVGTGSGALAVTLAAELPAARIVATDISPAAAAVARANALRHGVDARVTVVEGDLFACPLEGTRSPARAEFHLVVSNPPYVPERDIATLPPSVRNYEPLIALAAPGDGLEFHRRILSDALDRLEALGAVILELGLGQASALAGEMRRNPKYHHWEIAQDLAGIPRVLVAQRE